MPTVQLNITTPARFPLKVIKPDESIQPTTEGLSDVCRGWYIARGPVPTFDPEVWGAIANALDVQAPQRPSTANTTLTDEEAIKILSKPVADSNIGLTLYDEYIMNRTQGL